ncbi:MAG: hypothetical protein ACRD16_01715, partial [Thermoanaerobaculia bacterium]
MNRNLAGFALLAAGLSTAGFAAGSDAIRIENFQPALGTTVSGLGLLLPVVGRLPGSGNVLYSTTLEVSN